MIISLPTDGRTAFCAFTVHPDAKARRSGLVRMESVAQGFLGPVDLEMCVNSVGFMMHDRVRLRDSL